MYLQGYEPGMVSSKPLVAFVSFYHDQLMQFRSRPMAVSANSSTQLKKIPFSFSIDLYHFKPGVYTCQVSVLDPTDGKSAFWRAPIKILP